MGVDNFDLAAARARGITVARTTGSNAVPVAEFTLGLMIALLRNRPSAMPRCAPARGAPPPCPSPASCSPARRWESSAMARSGRMSRAC
ncbi:hypothetical protein [Teichococcus aestuarii]|uniref:hypothetical protein n=1 Tax=Teichococcus aestuarii TaxID=568898 RepID=UPI00360A1125